MLWGSMREGTSGDGGRHDSRKIKREDATASVKAFLSRRVSVKWGRIRHLWWIMAMLAGWQSDILLPGRLELDSLRQGMRRDEPGLVLLSGGIVGRRGTQRLEVDSTWPGPASS